MGDLKNAGEIVKAVVDNGYEELNRASAELTLSGLTAGLNASFSAVALGVDGALAGGVGIAAALWLRCSTTVRSRALLRRPTWLATRKKTNKEALEPVHDAAARLLSRET